MSLRPFLRERLFPAPELWPLFSFFPASRPSRKREGTRRSIMLAGLAAHQNGEVRMFQNMTGYAAQN